MKKNKLLSTVIAIVLSLSLVACGNSGDNSSAGGGNAADTADTGTSGADAEVSQGVTEDKILIGNTAAISGAYSTVGIPFLDGLNAALKVYNDAGGFQGKTVEVVHYDDGFNAEQGLTYTRKLVEEDQVFALVGHFGTPTVGATLDYITADVGIPMVYAATGISGLYNEAAEGMEKAVMSVQPIYNTEGRVLLARALAAVEGNMGLGGTSIGVISTTDEAGVGLLEGIKRQAEEVEGVEIKYVTTAADAGTNHSSAVNALATSGCDVIIVAANQTPFGEIMNYMRDGGIDNVKVITSYVSANDVFLQTLAADGSITATREVYTTAWLDINDAAGMYAPSADNATGTYIWEGYKALAESLGMAGAYDAGVPGFTEEYWAVAENITAYDLAVNGADSATAFTNSYNSYALAGYIAGVTFLEGLKRVDEAGQALNWDNYIAAMESAPIDIPMGGSIDLANGSRLGIEELALNKFDMTANKLTAFSPITSLNDVMAAVSQAK